MWRSATSVTQHRWRNISGATPLPAPAGVGPGTGSGVAARTDQTSSELMKRCQDRMNSSRSALILSACVVGIPCGKPAYVFSVPFGSNSADSGPESA